MDTRTKVLTDMQSEIVFRQKKIKMGKIDFQSPVFQKIKKALTVLPIFFNRRPNAILNKQVGGVFQKCNNIFYTFTCTTTSAAQNIEIKQINLT